MITNNITGQSYIGQSRDIMKRFAEHYSHRFCKNASVIDQFMGQFPISFFTFRILELCDSVDLDWKEDYWIKYYSTNKYGYNILNGGQHNNECSNPNHKLTSEDVYTIREYYNNHANPEEIYNNNYYGIISLTSFFNIWEGRVWPNIHMDVYTEENKEYYKSNIQKNTNKIRTHYTDEEIMNFRKRYINETAEEIYKSIGATCGLNTFKGIVSGQSYKHLPIYCKKKKEWITK